MRHRLPQYGVVRSPEELGSLARTHRKTRGLTLEQTAGVGGMGTRFLSELERGKPTAQLGKTLNYLQLLGLEVVVLPRGEVDRIIRYLERSEGD